MTDDDARLSFDVEQSFNVTLDKPDPELPIPSFEAEITRPLRRTWWQWLLRHPRWYETAYIPSATFIPDHHPNGFTITTENQ